MMIGHAKDSSAVFSQIHEISCAAVDKKIWKNYQRWYDFCPRNSFFSLNPLYEYCPVSGQYCNFITKKTRTFQRRVASQRVTRQLGRTVVS